MKLVLKVAFVE